MGVCVCVLVYKVTASATTKERVLTASNSQKTFKWQWQFNCVGRAVRRRSGGGGGGDWHTRRTPCMQSPTVLSKRPRMRTQTDTHAQPGAIKAEVLSVSFVPASAPFLPNMAPTTKRRGTELKIENARAGNAWKCVYVCRCVQVPATTCDINWKASERSTRVTGCLGKYPACSGFGYVFVSIPSRYSCILSWSRW